MRPGIQISRLWFDDDLVELQIRVSDGTSSFSNKVYVEHGELAEVIASLRAFRENLLGGDFDLRFGEFGPEFASGAFHARLHFAVPGRLFVACEQETEFFDFAGRAVASKAALFLNSEPVLLDRFLVELCALAADASEGAYLEAV
jgi:hypothetical protein